VRGGGGEEVNESRPEEGGLKPVEVVIWEDETLSPHTQDAEHMTLEGLLSAAAITVAVRQLQNILVTLKLAEESCVTKNPNK
jgi:hypothetical protein